MQYKSLIFEQLNEASTVLQRFLNVPQNIDDIAEAAAIMVKSIQSGGKIISCGNGGSMSDAMHFAEELTGRFRDDRRSFPAVSISDPTHISCVGNDYGYEYIFSRYVEGLGKKEDVLLGISTSGNSKNVILAAKAAQKIGMKVVALTGKNGGELKDFCDVEVRVDHNGYADRIQEVHIKIIHILIQLIENSLAN